MVAKQKQASWDDYYSPEEAAARLSENSGRPISKDYLRSLASYGVFNTKKIGNMNMYLKAEVDPYVVERRGEKLKAERRKSKKHAA
jgi:hypothetical protein